MRRLQLRRELLGLVRSLDAAQAFAESAVSAAQAKGATDELAIAVRALRTIANSVDSDGRSRGVARGALKRMGASR